MIINNLTMDEINFLKELKHELNTQSSRMTANPRIYQIRSEKFQTNPMEKENILKRYLKGIR